MKFQILLTLLLFGIYSCKDSSAEDTSKTKKAIFESIKNERFSVKKGNPDSTNLSNYIIETYSPQGQQLSSVYYALDNSVMMQFVNEFENGNKTKINWVNGQEQLVKYVKNTYNDQQQLIRSESFSPEGEFQSGFIHNWLEDGKIEEKGPIEEGKPFKPNAIYTYNENEEFELLKEYDANDSLYAVVKWNYTKMDEFDNWTERQMITNDVINQIEKRTIKYRAQ
jgi:hypothetical protein